MTGMERSRPAIAYQFAAAFNAQDMDALMSCFTSDATYRDMMFGLRVGHSQLRGLFATVFRLGRHRWIMNNVVGDACMTTGEWAFSTALESNPAGNRTARVLRYEGVSIFVTDGDRCTHYREYFDRTAILEALGLTESGIRRVTSRYPTATVVGDLSKPAQ